MSTTIRMAKIGKKNSPTYRIVVTSTKDKRNGKFLDIIGSFNPYLKENKLILDKTKFKEWKDKGAIISQAVVQVEEGKYNFTKYDPKTNKAKANE